MDKIDKALTYYENRITQLKNIYSHNIKFNVTTNIEDIINDYTYLNEDEKLENVIVNFTGKIIRKRCLSAQLFFYDLLSNNYNIQILADAIYYDDINEYIKMMELLHRGDTIGVIGFPYRSKENVLSIVPKKIILLEPYSIMQHGFS
jgi:lysyl-tRNA synthetase class II